MNKLVKEAIAAREKSYSPYSNFKVGAAVLLKDGKVIHGTNIENASYGLAMCAERNAVFNAYSQGYKKADIQALAIVGQTKEPISPCGACRQVLNELLSKTTPIYLANLQGDVKTTTIEELLPYSFDALEL